MKKCYISGRIGEPLPGQSKIDWEIEYCSKFQLWSIYVEDNLGMKPVNPTTLPHNHGRTWREYMNEDIRALLECDAIFLIDDWVVSRGAKIEKELAEGLGMELHYPEGWEQLPDIDRFVKAGSECKLPYNGFYEEGNSPKGRVVRYEVAFIGESPYWKMKGVV